MRAATVLVVALPGWMPLNAAIIDAFGGCITDRAEGYLLIRTEACPEGPSALQGWLDEHPRGV